MISSIRFFPILFQLKSAIYLIRQPQTLEQLVQGVNLQNQNHAALDLGICDKHAFVNVDHLLTDRIKTAGSFLQYIFDCAQIIIRRRNVDKHICELCQ